MLFHAPEFLFGFLPIVLLIYWALVRARLEKGSLAWLVLASLVFYGYWNPPYVILIVSSILVNYFLGTQISPSGELSNEKKRKWLFGIGLALNLGWLGYFKYADFFLKTANWTFGSSFNLEQIVLPLAISFFTFTQIAYLCDAYKGETRIYGLLDYSFFVTFFPHLIAGPIVQHHEIMPQVQRRRSFPLEGKFHSSYLVVGLSVFVLGLFKKMVLADGCAIYADPVFKLAASHGMLTTVDCWLGVLAYTFQLYFDFSGYSDMAIGLSYCFGFRLPINFDSPYRATSIIDFWRRWHISLSRFLKKYLYISLGGNRHGSLIRYRNLVLTMLLGGFWHGAGWNFIVWGGLHGIYLAVNHIFSGWRKTKGASHPPQAFQSFLGWALTFLAVMLAWVFFRASDLESAIWMLKRMFGIPVVFSSAAVIGEVFASNQKFVWLALIAGIAFFAPGSQRYFALVQPALERMQKARILWRPSLPHGILLGIMMVLIARKYFQLEPTTFLYFNF